MATDHRSFKARQLVSDCFSSVQHLFTCQVSVEVAPRPKAFEESNMAKGFSMAFIVEPKHCVRSQ